MATPLTLISVEYNGPLSHQSRVKIVIGEQRPLDNVTCKNYLRGVRSGFDIGGTLTAVTTAEYCSFVPTYVGLNTKVHENRCRQTRASYDRSLLVRSNKDDNACTERPIGTHHQRSTRGPATSGEILAISHGSFCQYNDTFIKPQDIQYIIT